MHPIALPKRFIHNRIYFAIFGLLAVDLASIGTTGPHFFRGVTLTLVLLSVDVWIRRRKSDLRVASLNLPWELRYMCYDICAVITSSVP